jgi:RNA polymerase sigma-70 factor (ECF subfamily)
MAAGETFTDTQRIWREFGDDLRRFILRRVNSPEDADDLLQETFIKIHGKLDTLEDRERLDAWVYQIARNTVTDYYRRQRAVESLPEGGIEIAAIEPEEPDNGVEQIVGGWLRPMVETLPERYRQALILTEFEGLSQREMAEKLGLSYSGAKSRVQRGRVMLKQQLVDCCHFEFDRRGSIIDYTPQIQLRVSETEECCDE